MDDKISIVIPVYNAQQFIEKLLDILYKQTYKNLEIIIVNDGSIDNTKNIIEKCIKKDKRIILINTQNKGVSSARNTGIGYVTGKYTTFIDADDYIEIDTYEKIYKKIKEKNTDAIRYNYIKEEEDGSILKKGDMLDLKDKIIDKNEKKEKVIPYIFENKIEAYSSLLILKSEIIKKVGKFNEEVHMMEDLLFYLGVLSSVDNIYFYDYHAYHYVLHYTSSSKSRDKLVRNFKDTLKVVKLVNKFLDENKFESKIYKQVNYIYSTMIVKYTIRSLQKDDEFKWSLDKLKQMLYDKDVTKLIQDVEFPDTNIYIKTVGNMIKNKDYESLYKYAESLKDILI